MENIRCIKIFEKYFGITGSTDSMKNPQDEVRILSRFGRENDRGARVSLWNGDTFVLYSVGYRKVCYLRPRGVNLEIDDYDKVINEILCHMMWLELVAYRIRAWWCRY